MYPYDQIIKILKPIKRRYKDRIYYAIYYDRIELDVHYTDGQIQTFSFTYNQVLKWYNNPIGDFKKAWKEKINQYRKGNTDD